MINLDAFYLTHTSEAVQLPDQEVVDAFIPNNLKPILTTEQPVTFGNVCGADLYTPFRYVRHQDTVNALEVWREASEAYAGIFGRSCPPVQTYQTEDADTILVVAGSAAGTLKLTVDQLREEGPCGGPYAPGHGPSLSLRLDRGGLFPRPNGQSWLKGAFPTAWAE